MKTQLRLFSVLIGLSAVLAAGCGSGTTTIVTPGGGGAPGGGGGTSVTVTIPVGSTGMGRAAYGVNPLVISAGTQVTWTNQDSMPHTATSDTGVWDSGTLNRGQSFSRTFSTPGTFPYFCAIHGKASQSGTIQVN